MDCDSPYMLLVAPVKQEKQIQMTDEQDALFGIDKLKVPRSEIPAVTHVDYSARVQTVRREVNTAYHDLIQAFYSLTECPLLVNTSFNVRGEPIVCTPEDAYRCFMRTEMDYLVLGNFLLDKRDQPEWLEEVSWQEEFALDCRRRERRFQDQEGGSPPPARARAGTRPRCSRARSLREP